MRIPNPESRIPNPESRIPNPESRIPNPESRIPAPPANTHSPIVGAPFSAGDRNGYFTSRYRSLGRRPQDRQGPAQHAPERPDGQHPLCLQ
ncbi:UNVERIFIED_CONTAM: hypothetical protein EX529_03590 [Xanthomonas citri pv. eucalyptorum]